MIALPKTKNAFAFRNFDKKKILQRPYFKDFHFDADKSDEEILKPLSLSGDDSLPTIEEKHKILNEIYSLLSQLRVLVSNHSKKRLEKYRKLIQRQIDAVQASETNFKSMKQAVNREMELESLQEKYKREQELAFDYILCIPDYITDLMIDINKKWQKLETRLQEMYREKFAERLRQARIKANLSRKNLGDAINISPNGFGLYETGKREPTLTSLIRLARTLNVTTDWLIGVTP